MCSKRFFSGGIKMALFELQLIVNNGGMGLSVGINATRIPEIPAPVF
jgi:hypothetical protein